MMLLLALACGKGDAGVDGDWEWILPPGVGEPIVPADNPMSRAKVELGRYLFYDTRLSQNNTQSCASCHEQQYAFGSPHATVDGSTGQAGVRNPQALVNVAWNASLTWGNPALVFLEDQIPVPLFGEAPVELGIVDEDAVMEALLDDPVYPPLFDRAFPRVNDPSLHEVTAALASFVRSLTSFDAPFDRYNRGEIDAMTTQEKAGMTLFYSEPLSCHHCHSGPNFTTSYVSEGSTFADPPFHNTGLYNIDGEGAYPPDNTGVYGISGDPDDMGAFRPVTLRNVAVTGPYLHDGSVETLTEQIEIYRRGGRLITEGPYAGDGKDSPLKSRFITGFSITDAERDTLVAFLGALTDTAFLTDPAHANPWEAEPSD